MNCLLLLIILFCCGNNGNCSGSCERGNSRRNNCNMGNRCDDGKCQRESRENVNDGNFASTPPQVARTQFPYLDVEPRTCGCEEKSDN